MEDLTVLLLHGFTSSLDTVNELAPRLEAAGIEYSMPVLRGHASRPEDLVGVTWRDWLEDAREALLEITRDGRRCAIVGLSMGGLLSLNLAAEHSRRVAGVVSVASCLRFRSPLFALMPILRRTITWWPGQPDYADPERAASDTNYRYFPVETLASLDDYRRVVESLLPLVSAPLCVIASSADPVVCPSSPRRILAGAASPHKESHWFHRSRHEMMRDLEREQVFDAIMHFLARVRSGELEVSENQSAARGAKR